LSTWLAGQPGDLGRLPLQAGPSGLRVLTGGPVPEQPTELLDSPRLRELLDDLRTQADLVILDAAPVLPFADTLALQRHVDGTVLVMDAGRTGTKLLERALGALQQTTGRVLGVVLNKDTEGLEAQGHGYERHGQQPAGHVAVPGEIAAVSAASWLGINGGNTRGLPVVDPDERVLHRR
jgi:Mrp family chromosome partitioning ATPase